jgi:putative endonuclease
VNPFLSANFNPAQRDSMFYVYIIYAAKADRYYIGQTHDFNERLKRHNSGYESATSPYIPWELKCLIEKPNRSAAVLLEKKLKNLNKQRVKDFIKKYK